RPISSSVSWKSKTPKFSAIRSGRTDLGMTTTWRWMSHRSTTWATDLPYPAPIWLRVGSENRWLRPSANGAPDSICPAPAQRAPGPQLDPPLTHQLLVVLALEERVGLDLVDRRGDVVVVDQVDQPVGVEVGDRDRLDEPLLLQLLHGPPGAVVVPEGLVDQVQVEVVEAEPGQRLLEGSLGAVLAAVVDPQLGAGQRLVPSDAAGGDGSADGLLGLVRLGGVEAAVAAGGGGGRGTGPPRSGRPGGCRGGGSRRRGRRWRPARSGREGSGRRRTPGSAS